MSEDISAKLPERIGGLKSLAYNLWWSWNDEAKDVFKVLDTILWRDTWHNPVRLLQLLPKNRLETVAGNDDFLARYDSAMAKFKQYMSGSNQSCHSNYPALASGSIAYFSMEFALHNSLPIYAGGLGVLAGDYCKEASDLGLPLVGVGLMYPHGYFQQHLTNDAWQKEVYRQLDFLQAPLIPVIGLDQRPLRVNVPLDSHSVRIGVWQVNVGRIKLFLLDPDLDENSPDDRKLADRLYDGDKETRLKQEILLGIGGVRVLRALGEQPTVWHANEGHTTFMMVERCRELIQQGMKFAEALEKVRATTVFTTHTPVPAGNDVFPRPLVEHYFNPFWESLTLTAEEFLSLGKFRLDNQDFNMTVLGLKMAGRRNGVSQLHTGVCRHMWNGVWPELKEEEVPICSVTNGVHVPTWLAPEMAKLYENYVSTDWLSQQDDQETWDRVNFIPDKDLMETRALLKRKLIRIMSDRARKRWKQEGTSLTSTLGMGALLEDKALTIGFSRRFTDYKRAALIFHDIERLKRILLNESRPVQLVFAGKAHPNDHRGKLIIQEILRAAFDRGFGGHIGFVEDYDIHVAHYLVQGVDVWLNNPNVMEEACGTSGMKAGINGVPHLSVMDGWWHEAYDGTSGWAIVSDDNDAVKCSRNAADADALYRLLEEKVIPLYYENDLNGIPSAWANMVKRTIRLTIPRFCARRMARDYADLYLAASKDLSLCK